jgi:hypothetical protein
MNIETMTPEERRWLIVFLLRRRVGRLLPPLPAPIVFGLRAGLLSLLALGWLPLHPTSMLSAFGWGLAASALLGLTDIVLPARRDLYDA